MLTTLRVESRQLSPRPTAPAFYLPHLHLAPSLGVTPFEFCRYFRHQKARVAGLSCRVVCVTRLRRFSKTPIYDRQTDGQTDTRQQLIPALASVARVKSVRCGKRSLADT